MTILNEINRTPELRERLIFPFLFFFFYECVRSRIVTVSELDTTVRFRHRTVRLLSIRPSSLSSLASPCRKIPFSPRTIPRYDPQGSVFEAPRTGFSRRPRVSSSTTANPATPPTTNERATVGSRGTASSSAPGSHVLNQSGYVKSRTTRKFVVGIEDEVAK